MTDMDYLNEWNNPEYNNTSIEEGRPQWFKLWVDKYVTALDIENLDEDLSPDEKRLLFEEVGKAFINSLFYFMSHGKGQYSEYKPRTRDGRILWNSLKRDIDQSYRDYDTRVRNGAKGGRPIKKPEIQ